MVDRPVEQVFAFLGDLENNMKWRPGQIEAKKISVGPIGVGTTYRMVNSVLGRRLEGEAEVTEYEPNRKFTSIGKSGFMPITAQRIFEPVEESTRVTFIAMAEPRGFLELAEPLLARRARARLRADAANAKRLLEADAG
jgi:carbon monoxide dehydrogenase subunit G